MLSFAALKTWCIARRSPSSVFRVVVVRSFGRGSRATRRVRIRANPSQSAPIQSEPPSIVVRRGARRDAPRSPCAASLPRVPPSHRIQSSPARPRRPCTSSRVSSIARRALAPGATVARRSRDGLMRRFDASIAATDVRDTTARGRRNEPSTRERRNEPSTGASHRTRDASARSRARRSNARTRARLRLAPKRARARRRGARRRGARHGVDEIKIGARGTERDARRDAREDERRREGERERANHRAVVSQGVFFCRGVDDDLDVRHHV